MPSPAVIYAIPTPKDKIVSRGRVARGKPRNGFDEKHKYTYATLVVSLKDTSDGTGLQVLRKKHSAELRPWENVRIGAQTSVILQLRFQT